LKIISADYLLICDESFTVLEKCAICFDEQIKEIAPLEVLTSKYPDAKVIHCEPNTVLMPGLTNVHVHLEFSANKTTLQYGDFIGWLNSVIEHRDTLSTTCDDACIDKVLEDMLQSGTTTIGAISSFGVDLNSCVKTPMNVVYFNEVLGSNPAAVDALYGDFLGRLEESSRFESDNFTPAISIHSPYSTHPILAKKALGISKMRGMVVSTHFMESEAERNWLDSGDGDFKAFFENFAPNARPVNDGFSYLELFEDQNILFTHATKATDAEFEIINALGTVTHCPVSNRLLGNGKLDINRVKNLTLGTDGLSSNSSLSLWDEMRAALMMHVDEEPNELAKKLILASTISGAKALSKKSGKLQEGYNADIISVKLPDSLQNLDTISLFLILHTDKAEKIIIQGKEIK
jgi:cytosine/adenosine deaminase-related metal-dependent hydrolase